MRNLTGKIALVTGRLVENRRSHGAARVGESALMKQRSKCNSR